MAKITISEYKHNTNRRLFAREISSAFFSVLALTVNFANWGKLLLAPFFVMMIEV